MQKLISVTYSDFMSQQLTQLTLTKRDIHGDVTDYWYVNDQGVVYYKVEAPNDRVAVRFYKYL